MLTFFLPAGIALRGLPVTRRLGSSLIAFALACYFVYPMSLILNQAIYENSDPINFQSYQNLIDICDKNKGGFSSFLDWLKDKTTVTNDSYFGQTVQHEEPGIFFKIVKWFGNLIKSTIAALQTVASFTSEFFYLFIDVRRASAQIYSLVIEQMTPAMQFMVFSIFVPILNIIVTVTAYRSLASALGGEEEIFGLSKIV
ncbi:hypothetical protein FJZ26_05240 [Candidatus Parvarchaeota archaeon]|nr:hypothetical protein [Candidatus Parvarchaeota archaeon]